MKPRCETLRRLRVSRLLHARRDAQRRAERKARSRLRAYRGMYGCRDSLPSIVRLQLLTRRLEAVARRQLRRAPGKARNLRRRRVHVLQAKRADKVAAFAGVCAPGSLWYREAPVEPAFVVAGVSDELVPIRGMRIFADAVVKKNECKGDPKKREDGIKVYSGKQPVWVWEYEGGHSPPRNCGEKVVEFFKSVMW